MASQPVQTRGSCVTWLARHGDSTGTSHQTGLYPQSLWPTVYALPIGL